MQIKGIHIRNFLSFETFTWEQIDPHLNMIVGPNGVGKTNLFHALRAVKDALITAQDKTPSSWSSLTYRDLTTPIIEIALDIEFTSEWEHSMLCACVAAAFCNESFLRDNHPNQLIPDDATHFSEFLLDEVRPETLAWFFSGRLIVSYDGLQWTCRYEGDGIQFHLHILGISNTSILEGVAWNEFTHYLFQRQQEKDSYFPTVQDVLQRFADESRGILLQIERPNTFVLPTHRIFEQLTGMTLQYNRFYGVVVPFQLLLEHALVFTDNIRRKTLYPVSESDFTTSTIDLSNGEQLALYLFKKKNGLPRDTDQYTAIKDLFHRITGRQFDISLRTTTDSKMALDIHVTNQWGITPLEYSGAGIAESLFLSSLIAGGDGRVVLLDEPASNIHVTMQKALMNEIRTYSQTNTQFLIVTHSPTLVDPGMLHNLSYFFLDHGQTARAPSSPLQVSEKDRKRLEQELRKSVEAASLLFSGAVLLVEGDTEQAVLPIWYEKAFNKPFNGQDITVYNVGGDQNFKPLLQFLHWLHIPWAIVSDGKVISYHLSATPVPSSNKSIIEQLEEAGIPCSNAFTRTDFSQLCQELEAFGVFTLAKKPGDEIEALSIFQQHNTEARNRFPKSKVRQYQYIAETYPYPEEAATLLHHIVLYLHGNHMNVSRV